MNLFAINSTTLSQTQEFFKNVKDSVNEAFSKIILIVFHDKSLQSMISMEINLGDIIDVIADICSGVMFEISRK